LIAAWHRQARDLRDVEAQRTDSRSRPPIVFCNDINQKPVLSALQFLVIDGHRMVLRKAKLNPASAPIIFGVPHRCGLPTRHC
jgi:hypothetical protein